MEKQDQGFITKFSLAFVNRSRVTVLILIAAIGVGFFTYASLLKREGFPPIEVPIAIIRAPYFVGNIDSVNTDVTEPIEEAIGDIKEIKSVSSTTTENFAAIVVEFNEGVKSESGAKLLKDEISASAKLPENIELDYQTFLAGASDGKHELLFTISGNKTIEELQNKAHEIAAEIEKIYEVSEANANDLIVEQINPLTGEKILDQAAFNRVGIRKDGEIEFNKAITIGIKKSNESIGTIELSNAVRDKIDELAADGELDGYDINYGGDLAGTLKQQIGSLESSIISGMLAVIVVLFLFVNWRASLVTALFIPTVLGATFIGLYLIGYSLNVLSLFGLILVLGLFVDDGIVIIEAIDYAKKQGHKGIEAVKSAINNVGTADISGTLTTLLVFVPMAMISGVLGDFIKLIPITVILALAISLVFALSAFPFITNVLIPDKKPAKKRTIVGEVWHLLVYGSSDLVSKFGNVLGKFIRIYMKSPILSGLIILLSFLLIGFGGFFATKLKFSIFPAPKDTDSIAVSIEYSPGTSIADAETLAEKVEMTVTEVVDENIDYIQYQSANSGFASMGITLIPYGEREETAVEIVDDLNNKLEDMDGITAKADLVGVGPGTSEFQYAMQVYGDDRNVIKAAAEELKLFLEQLELENDIEITEVVIANTDVIAKKDQRTFVEVKAKLSETENTGAVLEVENMVKAEFDAERLEKLGLGEDAFGFDLGQESENLESFDSAVFAFIVAMIMMYVLLVLQFNSYSQPLLVFTAIPFAFIGLFPGLFLTDNKLSFFVMLGLTGLIGIVVNNTIMLLDFANQSRKEGKGIVDSIVQAIGIRTRPILTTSITTIAGLLPLALTDPFWESLAFTIIFGLISSTFMVLLVFPAYYGIFEWARTQKSKTFKRLQSILN